MNITEVRIKLMEDASERLQAFCSITFDNAFVIRDLKIIEGANGPFVAMPSRKLTAHCHQCNCKNHLRAQFCNQCGTRLPTDRAPLDEDGRAKLYADIAHPINSTCREMIQERVIQEFREEQQRAKLPGYVSRYDDFYHEDAPSPRNAHHFRSNERNNVQPPEQQPRGPHRFAGQGASQQNANSHSAVPAPNKPPVKRDGFGAGIF